MSTVVSGLTIASWNDSEDRCAVPGVRNKPERQELEMTDRVRDIMRRLDRWTLTVFNPYYASDHRR
jgi:hypothetical protein